MAKDVVEFFKEEHNVSTVNRLLEEITVEDFVDNTNYNSPLSGKTVVFTGTLERMDKSRSQSQGAKPWAPKLPVRFCAYWIMSLKEPTPAARQKKARELGVRILSEDEFLELIK